MAAEKLLSKMKRPEDAQAVLLLQRQGWALVAQNARLVPRVELATQEDPLINGQLAVTPVGFSLSMGWPAPPARTCRGRRPGASGWNAAACG